MSSDVFRTLPAREGHFRLESGYHTGLWLSLETVFVDPERIAPLIDALAERLRPYVVDGVCGAFVGGAFLAQLLASRLRVRFFYAEPIPPAGEEGLFTARYRLPPAQALALRERSLAIVDDVISAGSSARAVIEAVNAAGARASVVACLMTLGDVGLAHFRSARVPMETLERRPFLMWPPSACPLCHSGAPLEEPG
jgi:orotate phosphoribosyltransferase